MKKAKKKWTAPWFADIKPEAEDGDYLREQQCCTSCGGYIGNLPGAFYIEDSDSCPTCRKSETNTEKWSDEVKRIIKRDKIDKDDARELIIELNKATIYLLNLIKL